MLCLTTTLTLFFAAACAAPTPVPEVPADGAAPAATMASATDMAAPTMAASTMAPAGALMPMPLADCQMVHATASGATGTRFADPIDVPYADNVTGKSGTACSMESDGTGVDFTSPSTVMDKIRAALTAAGWAEDNSQMADGPTGTATAFHKGADTIYASASWEPSADANCPKDQPISACPLTPEQQIYQVKLYAVGGAQ
jgi:hypothetical protein